MSGSSRSSSFIYGLGLTYFDGRNEYIIGQVTGDIGEAIFFSIVIYDYVIPTLFMHIKLGVHCKPYFCNSLS